MMMMMMMINDDDDDDDTPMPSRPSLPLCSYYCSIGSIAFISACEKVVQWQLVSHHVSLVVGSPCGN
eukprot:6881121-Karenia_brevis.AAC.1